MEISKDQLKNISNSFSEHIIEENDVGEVLIPFCMNVQNRGIICWQVCSAQMLSNDELGVGIKLKIKDFWIIDVRKRAFTISKHPFIAIHPNWPLVSLGDIEHGFMNAAEYFENSLHDDICMKRIARCRIAERSP